MRLTRAVAALLVLVAVPFPADTKKKRAPAKKAAPRITAAQRAAARDEIAARLRSDELRIENAETLAPFYAVADQVLPAPQIHILQFGDSHTASDDWVQSMRALLQAKYGDGGPGFVQAGRPYRGYRRYDARGQNSIGWKTQGTMALGGDAWQGLSGISISTSLPGQSVTLSAAGEFLSVFYLRQPGGGSVEVEADGRSLGRFSTEGETGPGSADFPVTGGPHDVVLRTLDRAPVRLYGWTLDNPQGLTWETLGINGAQANVLLRWDEALWSAEVAARRPALVVLAYGTNEANSARWDRETFRADLAAIVGRLRRAAPQAAILLIGPPDCGRLKPLPHLAEVVEAEREFAREQKVAFWDWRQHMGGAGAMKTWVTAGYAQADYIHMTGEGYRMVGEMIATSLLEKRQNEQSGQNR